MSSPGGREVGRVSIRVLPDTSGFRRQLQAELAGIEQGLKVEIPVEFNVNTAGLQAQLQALENTRVTIPVNLDPDIERLRAQLAALGNDRIIIPVVLDLDVGALQAQLAALDARSINIRVNVDGVALALQELAALEAAVGRLDGRTINIQVDMDAAGALAQIAALEAALLGLRTSIGSLNVGGGGAGGAGGALGGLVSGLGQALLLAPALALAGAAITAAWGAAATSIALIPAALALIGVPLGLLLIDFDGLKDKIKLLTPALQELKKEFTSALAEGLAPALEKIATQVIPQVKDGIIGIATTMGQMAQKTADFLASAQGIDLLRGMFDNVNEALKRLSTGLGDIGIAFLTLANQRSAFDVLTSAVNTFGDAFRTSVTELIADGALERAFQGLRGVVDSLAIGFVNLVDNGIRTFAGAAPGVKQFLDDLSGFFERFNWESLGTSVGKVFSGLGDTLRSVPTDTIRAIEDAFSRLGDVFKSQDFQANLRKMIEGIPAAIDLIGELTETFGNIGAAASGVVQFLAGAGRAFEGFNLVIEGVAQGIRTAFQVLTQDPFQTDWAAIGQAFADGEAKVRAGNRLMRDAFTSGGTEIQAGIQVQAATMKSATQEMFLGIGEAATTGSAAGFRAAEEASKREITGLGTVVKAEMAKVPEQVRGTLDGLGSVVQQSFSGLGGSVTTGMAAMNQAIVVGAAQLSAKMALGLQALGDTVQASFSKLGPSVTVGMASMVTAVDIGLQSMAVSVTNGMAPVGTALTTAFAGLAPSVTTGMASLVVAVDIGLQSMAASVTTGMTLVSGAFTTAFATLAPSVTTGMAGLVLAVDIGFQSMLASVNNGMLGFTTAINTGFTQTKDAAAAGMALMTAAVAAGFAAVTGAATFGMQFVSAAVKTGIDQMVMTVQDGLLKVKQAFVDGFNSITAESIASAIIDMKGAVTDGMASLETIVKDGMVWVQDAFIAGFGAIDVTAAFAPISQALQAAVDGLNTIARDGMQILANGIDARFQEITSTVQTNIDNAATAFKVGLDRMTADAQAAGTAIATAIRDGMTQARDAINGGVGEMVGALNGAVGKFRDAGSNMGAALAAGLRSQLGAVQAAAAALANAAAAGLAEAAKIRSPSRVFINFGQLMGAGLVIGLDGSRDQIIASARRIVDDLRAEGARVEGAFAFEQWEGMSSRLDGRVRGAIADVDITTSGGRNGHGPGCVTVNYGPTYNPVAEPASATNNRRLRTAAAMGVFG